MANLSRVISEAGRQLGLAPQANSSIVYGELNGYLVQLTAAKADAAECVVGLIRHGGLDAEEAIRTALAAANTASVGIKPKDVKVDEGLVTYTQKRGVVRGFDVGSVTKAFDKVFEAIRSSSPPPPRACRLCGGAEAGGPRLLNGVVDRVCVGCIDKLQSAAAAAKAAYDAMPTRFALATVVAVVLAAVGALVWGASASRRSACFGSSPSESACSLGSA